MTLKPRELEVLTRLAAGQTQREIATAMYLAESTIKQHTGTAVEALGARNRVHAVAIAYERGILGAAGLGSGSGTAGDNR